MGVKVFLPNYMKPKFILVLMLFSFLLISPNSQALKNNDVSNSYNINCPSPEDLVMIETFPHDLDYLFWADNLTGQNERLNQIGNGSGEWLLSPWGGYFISRHIEGADKWYLNAFRLAPVYAPHDGSLKELRTQNGTSGFMNGSEVIYDCKLAMDIGQECTITFGHISLLKTIYDEIQTSDEYTFTEGEFLGYPTYYGNYLGGIDFYYNYDSRSICPYPALSPALQTKLDTYFGMQYERMKLSGCYPQSALCTDPNIAIEDTCWGAWSYYTGPYDSYYEGVVDDFGRYETSFLTLFNRDFANPETYWRDIWNPNINLTSDILGIFGDNEGSEDIPGYVPLTRGHIRLVEGDYNQGILNLSIFWWSHYYPENTSLYARFKIESQSEGYEDDLLTFEHFETLIEAQTGFTEKNITYERFQAPGNSTDNTGYHFSIILSNVLLIIVICSFYKKKHRK